MPPDTLSGGHADFMLANAHMDDAWKDLTMTIQTLRWLLPGAVMLGMAVALLHLGWEHTHGGILRHHLLNDARLPAISNGWGVLVLPLLGALAGWAVARRTGVCARALKTAVAGFVGALAAGGALSLAFTTQGEAAATSVMMVILAASVVVPAYRAECLFGFVIGMTVVFGAVLPMLVACVPMLIAAFSRLVVWRSARWAVQRSRARRTG